MPSVEDISTSTLTQEKAALELQVKTLQGELYIEYNVSMSEEEEQQKA